MRDLEAGSGGLRPDFAVVTWRASKEELDLVFGEVDLELLLCVGNACVCVLCSRNIKRVSTNTGDEGGC